MTEKQIPEPVLNNIKEYLGLVGKEDLTFSEMDMLRAAQYGYNIAQVFVEDLKEQIKEYQQALSYQNKLL